jgi:hypothetical protein
MRKADKTRVIISNFREIGQFFQLFWRKLVKNHQLLFMEMSGKDEIYECPVCHRKVSIQWNPFHLTVLSEGNGEPHSGGKGLDKFAQIGQIDARAKKPNIFERWYKNG